MSVDAGVDVGAGVTVGAGVDGEVLVGCIAKISTGAAVEAALAVPPGASFNGRHAARKRVIKKRVRKVRRLAN